MGQTSRRHRSGALKPAPTPGKRRDLQRAVGPKARSVLPGFGPTAREFHGPGGNRGAYPRNEAYIHKRRPSLCAESRSAAHRARKSARPGLFDNRHVRRYPAGRCPIFLTGAAGPARNRDRSWPHTPTAETRPACRSRHAFRPHLTCP